MGRKGFLLSSNDRKKLAAEFLENRMYSIESYADELQAGVKYQDLNNNPSHGMTQSSSTPYRTGKLAFDDSRDTALRHIPSHKHRSYRDIKVGSAKVADKSFKKTIVPLLTQPVKNIESKSLIDLGRTVYWYITYKDGSYQNIPANKYGQFDPPRTRKRKNSKSNPRKKQTIKRKYLGKMKTFTFAVGQYAQTPFGIGKIIAFMDESSYSSGKGKYAIARFYKGSALYDNVAIGTDDEYIDHEINLKEAIPVDVQLISGKSKNPRRRKNSAAQRKAQSNAAKAMRLWQSGKAKSLKAAWKMVKKG